MPLSIFLFHSWAPKKSLRNMLCLSANLNELDVPLAVPTCPVARTCASRLAPFTPDNNLHCACFRFPKMTAITKNLPWFIREPAVSLIGNVRLITALKEKWRTEVQCNDDDRDATLRS